MCIVVCKIVVKSLKLGPQRVRGRPLSSCRRLCVAPRRGDSWVGWLTAVTEKLARSTAKAARRAGGMVPRAVRAGCRRKSSPAPGSSARPHQRPGAAAALLHILRASLRRDLTGAQARS